MFKRMSLLIVSIIALSFISGCFSFSSHQTAEVLEKDQVEWGEGFGYYMFDYEVDVVDSNGDIIETKKDEASFPYFPETIFRFGVMDNMDVGIKVSGLIANIEADLKYQVVQVGDKVSNFTFSVQPSASGMFLGDVRLYKFGLGLLASQRISSMFVVYGNIKYNYIAVSISDDASENVDGGSFSDGSIYTAALGISLEGKKWWIRPEFTITLDKDFNKMFYLPAIGFGLKF